MKTNSNYDNSTLYSVGIEIDGYTAMEKHEMVLLLKFKYKFMKVHPTWIMI